jgi:type III secretion system FlhB-like substrate exporter
MREFKAAAIGYNNDEPAPRVLARGIGSSAELLRRIAGENGIPVIESPDLADSLTVLNPFDFIPEKYWIAVAEVLKFVYETRGQNEVH